MKYLASIVVGLLLVLPFMLLLWLAKLVME